MERTNRTYWDPLGEPITKDFYLPETKALVQQVETYQKNPHRIRRIRDLLIILAILIIIIYVSMFGFEGPIIHSIVFSFLPLLIYIGIIHSFQQNFILF